MNCKISFKKSKNLNPIKYIITKLLIKKKIEHHFSNKKKR